MSTNGASVTKKLLVAPWDNEPHLGHGEFKGQEARSGQQSFGKGAITFIVSF